MIPPPNVTGTLHMGHAFQHTLMDALIRCHRMGGERALWQPGTDHAGIATQMVVERQLERRGQARAATSAARRSSSACGSGRSESGGTIARQMRRLGASVDWSRERFTMDEGLSARGDRSVRAAARGRPHLPRQAPGQLGSGAAHRALRPRGRGRARAGPALAPALSARRTAAVTLVVATTRPETMLGDTAVAVHPDDERYRHLVGKQRRAAARRTARIPVIADDYVDPAFGTGCVKITPAHDFNDYEVGTRHDLPLHQHLHGRRDAQRRRAGDVRGLDRFDARKRVVADLEAAGLLEKIEPHTLHGAARRRSGAVLEPWLTDQWYVKIAPLAEPAIARSRTGASASCRSNWSKTYFQWMRNIQDWCISRQLWWGHRIPAWYDDDGNIYVARNEADARAGRAQARPRRRSCARTRTCSTPGSRSALWPFSTLGWPEQTPRAREVLSDERAGDRASTSSSSGSPA